MDTLTKRYSDGSGQQHRNDSVDSKNGHEDAAEKPAPKNCDREDSGRGTETSLVDTNEHRMNDLSSRSENANVSISANRRLAQGDQSSDDKGHKGKGWKAKKEKLQRMDTDDGNKLPALDPLAPAFQPVEKGQWQRPGAAGFRRPFPTAQESLQTDTQLSKTQEDESDDEDKMLKIFEAKRKISRSKDKFLNAAMAITAARRTSTSFLGGPQATENVQRQVETLHTRIGVLEGSVGEMKDMQMSILRTLQQHLVSGVNIRRDLSGDRFSFDDNNVS